MVFDGFGVQMSDVADFVEPDTGADNGIRPSCLAGDIRELIYEVRGQ